MKYLIANVALVLSLIAPVSVADPRDDWWFDVEIIVFERTTSVHELREQFAQRGVLTQYSVDFDPLTQSLQPDISWVQQALRSCQQPPHQLWQAHPQLPTIIADYRQYEHALLAPIERLESLDGLEKNELLAPAQTEAEITGIATSALTSNGVAASELSDNSEQNQANNFLTITEYELNTLWLKFAAPHIARNNTYDLTSLPQVDCVTPALTSQVWTARDGWQWPVSYNTVPFPDKTPMFPFGIDRWDPTQPVILSQASNELEKLSLQIRSARDLRRILHTTWRQRVEFGRENADKIRLFAGKNYADIVNPPASDSVQPIDRLQPIDPYQTNSVESDSLPADEILLDNGITVTDPVVLLEQNLASTQPPSLQELRSTALAQPDTEEQRNNEDSTVPEPIWQLDGFVRVYLQNYNRVPYLHIDSELEYREPISTSEIGDSMGSTGSVASVGNDNDNEATIQIATVPFKQLRRIISQQLHYFDHPLFGMVIKVRRYQPPPPNDITE